jgi:hypothetical protein
MADDNKAVQAILDHGGKEVSPKVAQALADIAKTAGNLVVAMENGGTLQNASHEITGDLDRIKMARGFGDSIPDVAKDMSGALRSDVEEALRVIRDSHGGKLPDNVQRDIDTLSAGVKSGEPLPKDISERMRKDIEERAGGAQGLETLARIEEGLKLDIEHTLQPPARTPSNSQQAAPTSKKR